MISIDFRNATQRQIGIPRIVGSPRRAPGSLWRLVGNPWGRVNHGCHWCKLSMQHRGDNLLPPQESLLISPNILLIIPTIWLNGYLSVEKFMGIELLGSLVDPLYLYTWHYLTPPCPIDSQGLLNSTNVALRGLSKVMHWENKGQLGILAIYLIVVAKFSSDIPFSFASQFGILATSLIRVAYSHMTLLFLH